MTLVEEMREWCFCRDDVIIPPGEKCDWCRAIAEIERLQALIPARPENAAYLVWVLKPVRGEMLPHGEPEWTEVELDELAEFVQDKPENSP